MPAYTVPQNNSQASPARSGEPALLDTLALSPADAARLLSLSQRRVYELITQGKLAAYKSGTRTLVDTASCTAYLRSLPRKTPRRLFGES